MSDFFGGEFGLIDFGEADSLITVAPHSILRSVAELILNSKNAAELSIGSGNSLELSVIRNSNEISIRNNDYAEL